MSVPAVKPDMLLQNLWDGLRCYLGHNSLPHDAESGAADPWKCFENDECSKAPLYVTTYLVFNLAYNVLIILILKFGSANILWLAMTVMVPLGSMAFSLPFVPEHKPPRATDVLGLLVILTGLILYRFWPSVSQRWRQRRESQQELGRPFLEDLQ